VFGLYVLLVAVAFTFFFLAFLRESIVFAVIAAFLFAVLAYAAAIIPYETHVAEEYFNSTSNSTVYSYEYRYLGNDHPWLMWVLYGFFFISMTLTLILAVHGFRRRLPELPSWE